MKKIFTLSLLLALSLSIAWQLHAQTPRMAFYEEVTQASCPPCAGLNPPFQALLNANAETAVFIGYQVWWPGFDPMYLDNTEEVRDRVADYYGVGSAPTIILQGTPTSQTYNQGQINNVTAQMSEFAMTLDAEFLDGIIHVTGNVEAVMAASGDFRLRIALAEDVITIQDAPGGTNGETEYHHVFKRFLGGSSGINLANDWTVGDTYDIDLSLPVNTVNVYNYDQLEIIAWLQNDDTRYVHQAAKVPHLEQSFSFATNVAAIASSVVAPEVCVGLNTSTPTVTIANIGSETLTSVDIVYSLNEGEEQTTSWTGNLESYEEEVVTLDDITFEHSGETSILSISVSNPNGIADENEDDNVSIVPITTATNVAVEVRLILKTDSAGDEVYWQLADDEGTVVASGGNASVGLTNVGTGSSNAPSDPGSYSNNQFVVENIPLPSDGCYTFTITDYNGDGFGNGAGFYRLVADGEVFIESDFLTALEYGFFEGTMLVDVEDVEFTNTFTVSPNPVIDQAKVAFTVETPAVTTLSVINSIGQTINQQNLGKVAVGTHYLDLDLSGLATGIYLINIVSGEVSGTQTIVVN